MTDAPLDHPAVPVAVPKARSQWNDVWDQFRAHKGAMAGVIILGALIFAVLIGPFLWQIDPNFIERDTVKMFKSRNLPPSWAHPMGTDQLGRDTLARMMYGGRVSLAVGTVAMSPEWRMLTDGRIEVRYLSGLAVSTRYRVQFMGGV